MPAKLRPQGDIMKKTKLLLIVSVCLASFTSMAEIPAYQIDFDRELDLRDLDFIEITDQDEFASQNKNLRGGPINRDPISGQTYNHRIEGPMYTIAGNSLGNWIWDFVTGSDSRIFMRYITLYNKSRSYKKDLSSGPDAVFMRITEACHVNSIFMGEWSRGNSLTVGLEAGVGIEKMGLSASVKASIQEGINFTNTVRVQAIGTGYSAVHRPIMNYKNYEGVTLIAIYVINSNGQRVRRGYLTSRPPAQYITSFRTRYPYRFRLTHQDRSFGDEVSNVRHYPQGCRYPGVEVSEARTRQINSSVMATIP
tara:strand:- start:10629 stop:11555 length:927 start_codon:yes stop_codon:yes gene_type:complete